MRFYSSHGDTFWQSVFAVSSWNGSYVLTCSQVASAFANNPAVKVPPGGVVTSLAYATHLARLDPAMLRSAVPEKG
jgi:hypothetical protein